MTLRSAIQIGACGLLLLLSACSTEHDELIDSLPDNPLITMVRANGDPVTSITLEWDYANHEAVDEYRIYFGLYINFGQGTFDFDELTGISQERSYFMEDISLGQVEEQLCEAGLCDPLYTYSYFRVSAVIDGEEGTPGWRAFPSP